MAFKIRRNAKQSQQAFDRYFRKSKALFLQRVHNQGDPMLHDADKADPATDESGQPDSGLQQVQLPFMCPHGFQPVTHFIVAIDKDGKHFTNAPPQPNMALHLGTLGLNYVSQRAIMHIQSKAEGQRIVTAPAGIIPPWPGPSGRG